MSQTDQFPTANVTDCPPRQFGRYHYRRPLGSGGLGVVSIYFDSELKREVALKEIRSDRADDPRQRQYFCAEAEVTGVLEHPGIVPIYSMGINVDGRPYYVMRLITGNEFRDDIVRFHKAVKLGQAAFSGPGLRQLLQTLIDICNVIQYSHSRGVLHRDLKSANVMLGRYGETLVIDWGLAKTTGESEIEQIGDDAKACEARERPVALSSSSLGNTQDGMPMGTIAYAPPEQLNGRVRDIDSRSDTFSLGAILYEILTGDPPCKDMGLVQALNAIESQAVPPAHQVLGDVPKPLSAVASKAISPTKEQRYQTAEQLKNDIQRWLDDEPVLAYAESRWERISRWKRRHETFVRLATLSLALITLVSFAALYGINAARKQQKQARTEATQLYHLARLATDQLLARTSDRLSQVPDATDVQRGLLLDAVESYRRMAEVRSTDPELQRESARVAVALANVQRSLLETDDAIASLSSARTIIEKLMSPADDLLLARTYIEESRLQGDKGDLDAAKSAIIQALPLTERLTRGDTVSTESLLIRSQALIQRGIVESDSQDYFKAVESFESASNTLRGLLDRDLTGVEQHDVRLQLTRAYNNAALKRRNHSDSDPRIKEQYASAMTQADWLAEHFSDSSAVAKEFAAVLNNFGNYLLDAKDLQTAETLYQRSADLFADLSTKQPNILEHKERWILALTGLGSVVSDKGEFDRAIRIFEQAAEVSDQLLAQNRNRISFLRTASQAYSAFGGAVSVSNPELAARLLVKAANLLPKSGSDDLMEYIEGKQLELIGLALQPDKQENRTDRLRHYIEATQSMRTVNANYNAACVICRTCKQLIEEPDSNQVDRDRVFINDALDACFQRLAKAMKLSPETLSFTEQDDDLFLFREKRRDQLDSLHHNPQDK